MTLKSAVDRYAPAVILLLASAYLIFAPRLPQDQSYHSFADQRTILGIPNFWNVISNLVFAAVGALGLWKSRDISGYVIFGAIFATCFGSAYYHLSPNDHRLVWDRLPMAIVFTALAASVYGEGRNALTKAWNLAAFVSVGIGSVLWWRARDDLRLYAVVQFGALLLILSRAFALTSDKWVLALGAGSYVLAKLAEYYDRALFGVLSCSGHTLKHLTAGVASYCILLWWQSRDASYRPTLALDTKALEAR